MRVSDGSSNDGALPAACPDPITEPLFLCHVHAAKLNNSPLEERFAAEDADRRVYGSEPAEYDIVTRNGQENAKRLKQAVPD